MAVLVDATRASEPSDLIARVLAGEPVDAFKTQRRRRDGSLVDVALTISPVHDGRGRLVELSVIGHDISERKSAEAAQVAHLQFVQHMDRVEQAIRGGDDIDQVMADVLDVTIEILGCDRAFLLHPCDPSAESYLPRLERRRSAEVPVLDAGPIPRNESTAHMFRLALATDGPIAYGAGNEMPLPHEIEQRLGIRSHVAMALRPRSGAAWLFGLHECERPRTWTPSELALLREIGRRLTDSLSTRLAVRGLEDSEAMYRRLVDTANEGVWAIDTSGTTTFVNERMARMLGRSVDEVVGRPAADHLFPEDLAEHRRRLTEREDGSGATYERRWRRADGSELWTRMSVSAIIERGVLSGMFAMVTDIGERRRADEELRQSEEKFSSAFRMSPDLISLTRSSDGTILEVNEGFEQLLGHRRADAIGSTTASLAIWADEADRDRFLAELAEHGEVREFQTVLRHRDGSLLAVSDSARALTINGESCVLSVVRDVTDRRRAEAVFEARVRLERRRNEGTVVDLLRAALDEAEALTGSSIAFFHTVEPDERTITLQAWSTNTRSVMCAAEPTGHRYSVAEAGVWADALRLRAPVFHNDFATTPGRRGMPDGHATIHRELVLPVVRDGAIVALFGVGNKPAPFDDHDLRAVSALADCAWDLADRRAAQLRLEESETKYRTLIENIPDPIVRFDAELRRTYVNPAWEHATGIAAARAEQTTLRPGDAPALREGAEQVLATGRPDQVEFAWTNRQGRTLHLQYSLVPEFDADGVVTSVLTVGHDLTERHRNEELRIATQAAESASRAKSAFIANMSHEIRTPMNAILGFAQLLRNDPTLGAGQRSQLDVINTSGEHLLDLINDVLEISKIEAGRAVAVPAPFDLHALLAQVEALFAPRARSKGLVLCVHRDPRVPRHVVTDQGKLRQILLNLVGNAVKFTSTGTITVRVDHADHVRGGRLLVEVEDTGRGISVDDQAHLFGYFEQAGDHRETEPGTGLGLAISREFARLLGGDVFVWSDIGRGSTFRCEVDAPRAEATSVRSDVEERQLIGLANGERRRILVADDSTDNRTLMCQLLDQIGFETRAAANGQEAVDVFTQWPADLVLMDMRMPVVDGREATSRIKAVRSDVKVIAVTANVLLADPATALGNGVDGVLTKPFRISALFELIGQVLDVAYVFSDDPPDDDASSSTGPVSGAPTGLATIDGGLRQHLRRSAEELDFDEVVTIAAGLDDTLAAWLRTRAEQFDAESIIAALVASERPGTDGHRR